MYILKMDGLAYVIDYIIWIFFIKVLTDTLHPIKRGVYMYVILLQIVRPMCLFFTEDVTFN